MLRTIDSALYLIFALTGLFSVLYKTVVYCICKKNYSQIRTVVMCENHSELPDAVFSALLLCKNQPLGKRDIYVADNTVPSHIKILCHTCVGTMGRVHFISPENTEDIFKNNH